MYCEKCGNKLIMDAKFCNKCGFHLAGAILDNVIVAVSKDLVVEKRNNKVLWVIFIIIGVLVLIGFFVDYYDNSSSKNVDSAVITKQTSPISNDENAEIPKSYNQDSIVSSVVNILCDGDNESSGGSGTIIESDGIILTNNHIIPQDKKNNPLVEYCIVTLPDDQGKVKEIYYGEPIIIPVLSSEYDLAFIKISSAYTDDIGENYGAYPRVFPSFLPAGCENDSPKLGEKVTVFGYPAISGGGYYLTITDGVVSSLPNDGTIFTSAKVNHGSSGGLAVDKNGCMIGIPAMISGDENESLGVIISNDVIMEFINKLQTLLDK